MDLQNYQIFTPTTAIYPQDQELEYLALGLTSEAGEVAGVVKKLIRQDCKYSERFESRLKMELGDCLYYMSQLCNLLGTTFEELAELNYRKLSARQQQGTIQGDGEERETVSKYELFSDIPQHIIEAIDHFDDNTDSDTLTATWGDVTQQD